jgi:acetyl esterase/lipase
MPYGKDQMSAIAGDLCARGFAVWNIEYRRIGEPQVGWSEMSSDVWAALEFLQGFSEREHRLDLNRASVVGHSAGGQLALACTTQQALRGRTQIRPAAVAALAAISDLEEAFASNMGNGAARDLLGGSPAEQPDRYAGASPRLLLPHGSRLLLLHGASDEYVPISQSRRYAEAARSAGDDVSYVELDATGHMEFLDPGAVAYRTICDWLQNLLSAPLS